MTGVAVKLEARGALGRVAIVTVENERKLNILDPPRMAELERALAALAQDAELRVLVLRGAGDKAFIGGADIRAMAGLDTSTARAFISGLHRVCEGLRRLPVPAIARIEGYALGAGLEIAAACDMRVAASSAKLGIPEVKVGIPSVIEAALLPQLIGWGRTRRLLFTGEIIDAEEAERWGLLERVVEVRELDAAVEEWVAAILAAGPRAIRLQKSLIRQWEELATSAAIRRGVETFAEAYGTPEPAERMGAFLRRKKPQPRA
ncbi:MAG TPA: enoyl-CoA hydratase [Stellaceae bacterium]|nr:enoyl-CoA hydratase [Stellaceae bacterium]